jgi:hypothetical protein
MMSPSPMLSDSPAPSYAAPFDTFVTEKPFDDFSAQYAYHQTCSNNGLSINSDAIYNSFGGHHHQVNAPLTHLDMDFSAFMTAIPQYAI